MRSLPESRESRVRNAVVKTMRIDLSRLVTNDEGADLAAIA
jgi:hypothetical protein